MLRLTRTRTNIRWRSQSRQNIYEPDDVQLRTERSVSLTGHFFHIDPDSLTTSANLKSNRRYSRCSNFIENRAFTIGKKILFFFVQTQFEKFSGKFDFLTSNSENIEKKILEIVMSRFFFFYKNLNF